MSLESLNKRITVSGGNQHSRMVKDKLKSLKQALKYSYQSSTIELSNGKRFLGLINRDKETGDYDDKILSIPFSDICLNYPSPKGEEDIGLKGGDVIKWVETDTHWILSLIYLEEVAYLRAKIYKCSQEIEINGKKYWVYLRGPVETSIPWNQKAGVEWNDINYSLIMYITLDDNTANSLHRFTKVKITDPVTGELKTWQVVGRNAFYGDGIIKIALDEDFENEFAADLDTLQPNIPLNAEEPYIEGLKEVSAFSTVEYSIKNADGGMWYVDGVAYGTNPVLELDVIKKKGNFVVSYKINDEEVTSLTVTIKPI